MADRKAELERKKAKLEQMRKERQEKDKIKKLSQAETPKPQNPDLRAEAEKILRDIGIDPNATTGSPERVSKSSTPSQGSQDGDNIPAPTVFQSPRKTKPKLSVVKVTETSIAPKENVTYCKETQTATMEHDVDDEDAESDSVDAGDTPSHKMPNVEMVKPATTAEDLVETPPIPQVREMSEEEKEQIIRSDQFQSFFHRTSQYIERALHSNVDVTEDYAGDLNGDKMNDLMSGEMLNLNRTFFDERWTKNRVITALNWSTKYPELLVAAYNSNEDSPRDPDGVALIWNVKFKKDTPDYIFHCQSALMSCCFADFHPNLVIGGTYSGQIVMWDNRVYKRTPVQRTSLSSAAHHHPIYCLDVIGTVNAHNLVSISNDGRMCTWSLDMLSQPQETIELQHKQCKNIATTCMCFPSGEVNNFVVGSEECTVYSASRHGSKAGINESYEGHYGPITGIDCHAVPGQIDFSPFFLTSSFDWSVKLWSTKEQNYIHSFEDNSDYVYDVQWSPVHPALFASVDGVGRLDLWHLNNNREVPTASVNVDNMALNKCRWHDSGRMISVGDDEGTLHVYDVGEQIANPKSDEWSQFVHTIQELRQESAEREQDAALLNMSSNQPRV